MLSLADRLTVPQVFFNDVHIGGADDTLAILNKWEEEIANGKYKTLTEIYENKIVSKPDSTDPRLAVPTTPPVVEQPEPPRDEMNTAVKLPDGTLTSVLDLTTRLGNTLPRKDLPWNLTVYKNCFTGKEAVNALTTWEFVNSRDEAVEYGNYLLEKQILDHVLGEHEFKDKKNLYFRLSCYQDPNILNSFRVWTERVDPNAMGLLKRLKGLMGKIESAVTDKNGDIDYIAARDNDNYKIFEEAVCELQGVKLDEMDEKTRLAFGINVYNLMIKYAFIKVGIAKSNWNRGHFFKTVKFNIGGVILSFNDLENGIIRANGTPPYALKPQFDKKDPRLKLALEKVDCRIHFALNCGAKSCPPVKNFTADAIDEELRIVSQAFAEQEENVAVDEANSELRLTMILSWYQADFADSAEKLPAKIVTFLRGSKKDKLQKMIDSGKPIRIKYNTYDWSTNASRSDTFSSSKVKPNQLDPVKAVFG